MFERNVRVQINKEKVKAGPCKANAINNHEFNPMIRAHQVNNFDETQFHVFGRPRANIFIFDI